MTLPKNKNPMLEQEKRERYFRNLIQEAIINTLAEQEADRSAAPPSPVTPAPETNQPPPPEPPPEDEQQQQPGEEEFTADTLVDKLNVLRGGKSFTDPEVFGQLTTFFNNLTDEQKASLKYFLSEMGKIVIGVTEQEAGLEHNSQQQQRQQPSGQAQRPPGGSQAPKTAPASAPAATGAPVTPSMGV